MPRNCKILIVYIVWSKFECDWHIQLSAKCKLGVIFRHTFKSISPNNLNDYRIIKTFYLSGSMIFLFPLIVHDNILLNAFHT